MVDKIEERTFPMFPIPMREYEIAWKSLKASVLVSTNWPREEILNHMSMLEIEFGANDILKSCK